MSSIAQHQTWIEPRDMDHLKLLYRALKDGRRLLIDDRAMYVVGRDGMRFACSTEPGFFRDPSGCLDPQ